MPAVIDTHELINTEDIETHDFTIEQPPARKARPGGWRMLAHKITQYLTPTPRKRHAPMCSASRPFEAPRDRVAREYPSLTLYAHAIL